eukprot:scaffold4484_cov98-Isochrysis_galbana.AAC.8
MGGLLGRCFRGCAECRKILVQAPSPAPVGLRRASQGPVYRLIWAGKGPGSLMSSRPVARRRKRYSASSSGAGDGE